MSGLQTLDSHTRRAFAAVHLQLARALMAILDRPLQGDQRPADIGSAREILLQVHHLCDESRAAECDPHDAIIRIDTLRDYWPTWARLYLEGR
jgi:hypothetical protein